MLIVFDDIVADMINNKKLNPVVTEFFIRGRKIKYSIVFITRSYFKVQLENHIPFWLMIQLYHQIIFFKI